MDYRDYVTKNGEQVNREIFSKTGLAFEFDKVGNVFLKGPIVVSKIVNDSLDTLLQSKNIDDILKWIGCYSAKIEEIEGVVIYDESFGKFTKAELYYSFIYKCVEPSNKKTAEIFPNPEYGPCEITVQSQCIKTKNNGFFFDSGFSAYNGTYFEIDDCTDMTLEEAVEALYKDMSRFTLPDVAYEIDKTAGVFVPNSFESVINNKAAKYTHYVEA